jgi:hypothetical protein
LSTPASVGLKSSRTWWVLLYPFCDGRRPVIIMTKLPRVLGQNVNARSKTVPRWASASMWGLVGRR